MSAFLLSLGVLATAIGVTAIGFGIPNHEFGLGSTLIISGTVAVIGGMVLLGLSAAVRQLRRIADAMGQRPVAAPRRQPQPVTELADAPARAAPGQRGIPYPPRPDGREGRAAEMRPAPVPVVETPAPPLERARPNVMGLARGSGDTPMVAEPEAVPLAPMRPPPASGSRGAPPMAAPAVEPRTSPADIMSRLSNLAAAPAPRQMPRSEPPKSEPPRSEPLRADPPRVAASAEVRTAVAPRQRANMFDSVWPAQARGLRQSEAVARAPRLDMMPEPAPEPRIEPVIEPRIEPRIDARLEPKLEIKPDPKPEPPTPRERADVNVAPRETTVAAAEPRPMAILKSGVIDGMAYTLYTDGSIEAELPQGTMRFASIEELRAHLEKAERQA